MHFCGRYQRILICSMENNGKRPILNAGWTIHNVRLLRWSKSEISVGVTTKPHHALLDRLNPVKL